MMVGLGRRFWFFIHFYCNYKSSRKQYKKLRSVTISSPPRPIPKPVSKPIPLLPRAPVVSAAPLSSPRRPAAPLPPRRRSRAPPLPLHGRRGRPGVGWLRRPLPTTTATAAIWVAIACLTRWGHPPFCLETNILMDLWNVRLTIYQAWYWALVKEFKIPSSWWQWWKTQPSMPPSLGCWARQQLRGQTRSSSRRAAPSAPPPPHSLASSENLARADHHQHQRSHLQHSVLPRFSSHSVYHWCSPSAPSRCSPSWSPPSGCLWSCSCCNFLGPRRVESQSHHSQCSRALFPEATGIPAEIGNEKEKRRTRYQTSSLLRVLILTLRFSRFSAYFLASLSSSPWLMSR